VPDINRSCRNDDIAHLDWPSQNPALTHPGTESARLSLVVVLGQSQAYALLAFYARGLGSPHRSVLGDYINRY
jgi:hypothetical protein